MMSWLFQINVIVGIFEEKLELLPKLVPMQKIEHIGIAVKDIEESNLLFAKLLNTQHYKMEAVPSEGVITSFFQVGEVKIELLQATCQKTAPFINLLRTKGEGCASYCFCRR